MITFYADDFHQKRIAVADKLHRQSNFQLFFMLSNKTDLTKVFHSNQGTGGCDDPSGWGIQFGHNEHCILKIWQVVTPPLARQGFQKAVGSQSHRISWKKLSLKKINATTFERARATQCKRQCPQWLGFEIRVLGLAHKLILSTLLRHTRGRNPPYQISTNLDFMLNCIPTVMPPPAVG